MCLLIWTVFSGERCGPWASCIFYFSCRSLVLKPWDGRLVPLPHFLRPVTYSSAPMSKWRGSQSFHIMQVRLNNNYLDWLLQITSSHCWLSELVIDGKIKFKKPVKRSGEDTELTPSTKKKKEGSGEKRKEEKKDKKKSSKGVKNATLLSFNEDEEDGT